MTDESTVVESTPPTQEGPSWFIDDHTPGIGLRPDWLPKKYNKVSDLAKSYTEVEKKLGAFTGAPEEYKLDDMEIDESQFVVQEWKSLGKELNMSEEALKKFIGRTASAFETQSDMHLDDQVKALGEDGHRMLTEYKNWTKDYLKPEEVEVVTAWVRSADDLKVFNRMMANTHMSSVPTNHAMTNAPFETVAELRNELTKNIGRFDTDRAYQKDWSARMGRAASREK